MNMPASPDPCPSHPHAPQPAPARPSAPMQMSVPMPGKARTTRGVLYVLGGLQSFGALGLLAVTAARGHDGEAGVRYATAGLALILAAASFILAARFATGGPGVRTGAIVLGAVVLANALLSLAMGQTMSGPGAALGALLLVNCLTKETTAWFHRPRP
ncbi:hypothetical protein AB0K09_09485 [Streptomyces sp. NPDC049577]|uniref:hypothetical protein n=1 Tax=Streptomyces sp. NPDC049577 TaxID=3155153 RepID=UPI003416D003